MAPVNAIAAAEETYVCRCLKITADDLQQAVLCHAIDCVAELCRKTGAGTGCTACRARLRAFLERPPALD